MNGVFRASVSSAGGACWRADEFRRDQLRAKRRWRRLEPARAGVDVAPAWALGQCGDGSTAADLLAYASSPEDVEGVGLWALGELGERARLPDPRAVVERLPRAPGAEELRWKLGLMALHRLGVPQSDRLLSATAAPPDDLKDVEPVVVFPFTMWTRPDPGLELEAGDALLSSSSRDLGRAGQQQAFDPADRDLALPGDHSLVPAAPRTSGGPPARSGSATASRGGPRARRCAQSRRTPAARATAGGSATARDRRASRGARGASALRSASCRRRWARR